MRFEKTQYDSVHWDLDGKSIQVHTDVEIVLSLEEAKGLLKNDETHFEALRSIYNEAIREIEE